MGLAKMSKKERKSGYLALSQQKAGGKLDPTAKWNLERSAGSG